MSVLKVYQRHFTPLDHVSFEFDCRLRARVVFPRLNFLYPLADRVKPLDEVSQIPLSVSQLYNPFVLYSSRPRKFPVSASFTFVLLHLGLMRV